MKLGLTFCFGLMALVAVSATITIESRPYAVDTLPQPRLPKGSELLLTSSSWQNRVAAADAKSYITHVLPGGREELMTVADGDVVSGAFWRTDASTIPGIHLFRHEISPVSGGDAVDVMTALFKVDPPEGERPYALPENAGRITLPERLSDWADLYGFVVAARDSIPRLDGGEFVPPSENPIVISLGAVAVSQALWAKVGESVAPVAEHGVDVCHVFVQESGDESCGIVVGSDELSAHIGYLLPYDARKWTEAVYGAVPSWLAGTAKDEWYRLRRPSRIRWFLTLVPESVFSGYCSVKANSAASVAEGLVDSAKASANSDGQFRIRVNLKNDGKVELFGKNSSAATGWDYRGCAYLTKGVSTIGGFADSESVEWKVVVNSPDSDGDGLSDAVETFAFGTDPNRADTSGDGLSDWDEINLLGTNPKVRDTDGDGFEDDEEVGRGTNPMVANPGAATSIRYVYDEDDRVRQTRFGSAQGGIKIDVSPAGNNRVIKKWGAK